jgi:hypothetical protein
MYIKELKEKYTLILRKMNGQPMGTILYQSIESITKGIQTISELTFTVSKYYGVNNEINPLYDELKNERFIDLDDVETYIIKSVKEVNDTSKTITAYSREKKLCKSKVEFEDICLTLKTRDENVSSCYTLDELLYEDTGWRLGYISDRVLYTSNLTIEDILNNAESDETNITNIEKLRYQESVSTNWYDYIMDDISTQFECYPIFDSYNKVINLYDESELGDNLELVLSYDNYLKLNEKTTSTEEIVTRLTLVGNEDLTVVNCNPTGLRYIENFTYYIENEEMSNDLIDALELYDIMTKERTIRWNELRILKEEKNTVFTEKQKKLLLVYSMIQSLETALNMTTSDSYKSALSQQLTEQIDQRTLLERDINILYAEIQTISEEITALNKLCRKEYATDRNGDLIFDSELLDELKEFIYQDTYTNDNITSDTDLLKLGLKQLGELSRPTKSWTIDSVNFIERLLDNDARNQWEGQLGLGDMIILKGDTAEPIYLVGYTQDFKNQRLHLQISNKKANNDFSLSIGERLTQAKEAYEDLKANKYLLNSIKLKRLGVSYDKINRGFL